MSLGLASHTPERLLQPGETYQALLGTFGRGALLLRGAQDFPGGPVLLGAKTTQAALERIASFQHSTLTFILIVPSSA